MLISAQAAAHGDLRGENPIHRVHLTCLNTIEETSQVSHCIPNDITVFINICGLVFETQQKTLNRFPMTLLGDNQRRNHHFRESQDDFYFDRHRESFSAILYYYQSGGIIRRPANVPYEIFEREVEFFDLGDHVISKLREHEGYTEEDIPVTPPSNKLQRKVWELFEVPESGIVARITMSFSVLVILLSVAIFCLDSLPGHWKSLHMPCNSTFTSSVPETHACDYNYMEFIQLLCNVWFTFEYVMRFICSPNKWLFLKNWLNMIDLVVIIPYFVVAAIGRNASSLGMIKLLRIARIFRIIKLSRYFTNLQLMGKTLRASLKELRMLTFFLLFGVITFASALFYAENERNPDLFPSIPETFWFALVTMTTVGYGDRVPMTAIGKIIGGVCACSGVVMVAMVLPIISDNFERYYHAAKKSKRVDPSVCKQDKQAEEQPLWNGSISIL